MRRLILLRPEPGARESLEQARALGLDAEAIALFRAKPVAWQVPDASRFDALLLTSANAPRHGGEGLELLRGLPVVAVGEATARAARQRGFHVQFVGNSGVDRLLACVPADLRLLYLCGADRTEPSAARQHIETVVVYHSEALDIADLPERTGSCVAAVHSARAAARLAELIGERERRSVRIAAISKAAAAAAGRGWERIETAGVPTDAAVLALAARLCKNGHG